MSNIAIAKKTFDFKQIRGDRVSHRDGWLVTSYLRVASHSLFNPPIKGKGKTMAKSATLVKQGTVKFDRLKNRGKKKAATKQPLRPAQIVAEFAASKSQTNPYKAFAALFPNPEVKAQ